MAPRARDGGLYCSDGLVAGACNARSLNAGSLYTRRPMAPIGVEIGWLAALAMGDFISRMDASRARVMPGL